MANIEVLRQKLESLAEAIRGKTGTTGKLSLDDMFTAINNIPITGTGEISYGDKLKNKLESIANAVRAKTGDSAPLTLDEMIAKINNLVLQVTGTVTPSDYITITRNLVTRQGNLVTVDVVFDPKKTLYAETLLFTLPHGWKPKQTVTFWIRYPSWVTPSTIVEAKCYLNLEGQAFLTNKDAYTEVNIITWNKSLSCNFEFEAI